MSGSYRQCPDCGKRALSIATRCPGCGRELPPRQSPERASAGPRRALSVQSVLGLVALGAALMAGWESRRRAAAVEDESSYLISPARSAPEDAAALDTAQGTPPLASTPLAATPRLGRPPNAPASSLRPLAPAVPASPLPARPPAAPAATDTGRLLVARTWTHVRNRRSVHGSLAAVLTPGDTVLADSLSHGWYRVALEGEVMGYASASALTADAPSRAP
jgi:hypothetical protein